MKKLELKHLKNYIDHNVKFINEEAFSTLVGIVGKGDNTNELMHESFVIDEFGNEFYLGGVNLILRPLSDLTSVIELANGKCLIPAEILYRIGCEGQTNPFNPKHCYVGRFKYKQFNDSGVDVLHIIPIDDKRHEILEITYGEQVNFQRGLDRESNSAELYACVEQMQLFQRLFEWHFDIYGLIPAGLAIDINTLGK